MILFASTAVADKNASLNTKADGSTKGEEMKPNGPSQSGMEDGRRNAILD